MWSSIEACVSVICASLPCYAPLLKKAGSLGPFVIGMRSLFSLSKKDRSRSASSKQSMQKGASSSSSERIILEPTSIESSTRDDTKGSGRGTDMEMGQIRLKTVVDIERSTRASEAPAGGTCSPCLVKAYLPGFPRYPFSEEARSQQHTVLHDHKHQCLER